MFFGIYTAVLLGWYVLFAASLVVLYGGQLLVMLWRFIDDNWIHGFWFVPHRFRKKVGWQSSPAGSWRSIEKFHYIMVLFLVGGALGGFLWPIALPILGLIGFCYLLRGLRRGQKKINAVIEVAHKHADGSGTSAGIDRLSLR